MYIPIYVYISDEVFVISVHKYTERHSGCMYVCMRMNTCLCVCSVHHDMQYIHPTQVSGHVCHVQQPCCRARVAGRPGRSGRYHSLRTPSGVHGLPEPASRHVLDSHGHETRTKGCD